jgi:hypothetical protein
MLVVVGAAGAGDRTNRPPAAAAAAQDPPLSTEDEFWVADTAASICDEVANSSDEDEDCESSLHVKYHAPLSDCLRFARGQGLDTEAARTACRAHVRTTVDPEGSSVDSIDRQRVLERVNRTVSAATTGFSAGGVDQATVDTFAAEFQRCAVQNILQGADFGLGAARLRCAEAYRPIEAAWIEAATQAFVNSLTPLLDQGRNTADLLSAGDALRACLQGQLSGLSSQSDAAYDALLKECKNSVTLDQGLLSIAGAPSVGAVACSPSPVAAGDLVSCSATVSGAVTGWQWSAPGGNPNALEGASAGGSSMGETVTFTTWYATSGDKTVELTACNRVPATAEAPERTLCAVGTAAVSVTAVAPTIDALSCTAGPVAPGDVVSCTATVGGSTGSTSRRWSAPGGDPSDGRGPSFSTQYARANTYTITFRTCNGPDPVDGTGGDPRACAEASRSVQVRGETAPVITGLGCPAMAAVNDPVTCTPSITGMVTSRTWVATGGTPPEGTAMTFTTRFASAGSRTIVLQACNGMACATSQQAVMITGMTRCTQWDVSGNWNTAHSNGSYHPSFTFSQTGTTITGTGTLPAGEQANAQYTGPGTVTGSMKGDQLDVVVTWPTRNGAVQGRYFGTVTQGRVSGMGVAVGASSGIGWTGSGPTRCVTMA